MEERTEQKGAAAEAQAGNVDARAHVDAGIDTNAPDSQVVLRPQRRRFTTEYKERMIAAVDACSHGEIGALLRHEGLTSSMVSRWRRERDSKIQEALKYMEAASGSDPRDERIAVLERKL